MKELRINFGITDRQYNKLLELAELTGRSVETAAAAVLLDGLTPRLEAFIRLSKKEPPTCCND